MMFWSESHEHKPTRASCPLSSSLTHVRVRWTWRGRVLGVTLDVLMVQRTRRRTPPHTHTGHDPTSPRITGGEVGRKSSNGVKGQWRKWPAIGWQRGSSYGDASPRSTGWQQSLPTNPWATLALVSPARCNRSQKMDPLLLPQITNKTAGDVASASPPLWRPACLVFLLLAPANPLPETADAPRRSDAEADSQARCGGQDKKPPLVKGFYQQPAGQRWASGRLVDRSTIVVWSCCLSTKKTVQRGWGRWGLEG